MYNIPRVLQFTPRQSVIHTYFSTTANAVEIINGLRFVYGGKMGIPRVH